MGERADRLRDGPLCDRVSQAIERARAHLLARQDPAGWWKGELETNVTMDAEDLLMREFLGIRTREETVRAAHWIRAQQRDDGSWANYYGGPPDLSTTIEAYAALRLAEDPPESEHMKRAREVVLGLGGIEASRVFTRIWLALFGEWSWDDLPALPPELILLPPWFPLNVYDFACWARQTIVPLTIVGSHRPVRPLPFSLAELRGGPRREPVYPISTWKGRLQRLDRALQFYERHPLRPLRRLARRLGCEWILQRQEADGSWGGIQPPWVYSVLALHLEGYPLDHPALRRAVDGFARFTIEEGDVRRLEACQSPVWDTALAMVALRDVGVAPDHPAMVKAADWIVGEEVRIPGDWAVRRPDLAPSGWAFEFDNDRYPDIDDTAEVILGLRAARASDEPARAAALERAIAWVWGMQSSDHGWAAFDADNTRALCRELPFCDFGEVIDPPSADVTAHVVEMLAEEGHVGDPRVSGAIDWLLRAQEPGGSWFGRWGANHLYGTGAVVPALVAAGLPSDHAAIRRAVRWLLSVQNADGGWGEDLRSYTAEGAHGQGGRLESRPTRSEPKASEGGPLHGQGGRLESRPTRSEPKASEGGPLHGQGGRLESRPTRSEPKASEGGPLHGQGGRLESRPQVREAGSARLRSDRATESPDQCSRSEAKPSEDQKTRSERKPSGAQRGEAERRSNGWASEGGPLHELGDSTASQTAWALLALLAAGERGSAVERGIAWLVGTQRPDGNWNEPQYTGTGFPGDFYINYHLYRLVFPIMALGRYASGLAARSEAEPSEDRTG